MHVTGLSWTRSRFPWRPSLPTMRFRHPQTRQPHCCPHTAEPCQRRSHAPWTLWSSSEGGPLSSALSLTQWRFLRGCLKPQLKTACTSSNQVSTSRCHLPGLSPNLDALPAPRCAMGRVPTGCGPCVSHVFGVWCPRRALLGAFHRMVMLAQPRSRMPAHTLGLLASSLPRLLLHTWVPPPHSCR